jgi:serine protease Do
MSTVNSSMKLTALGMAAVCGAGIMYMFSAGPMPSHAEQRLATPPPAAALEHATGLSTAFRYASGQAMPAVVTIQHTAESKRVIRREGGKRSEPQIPDEFKELDPFLRRFFEDMPDMREMPRGGGQSAGSGVIIDKSGLVLTNNHVVEGGGKIVVRLTDGREFEASEIKTDPSTDLAIVRIKATGDLPVAALGDSDAVQVGDWVLALGQPFGLANTVTAGIISAKGRGIGITEHEEFLQTDAAINPGNSGGPLVNLRGEVIGINTAISSTSGGYQGIGFAVPVNVAKWVSRQLSEEGLVHRAYLGIGIQPVTSEIAAQLGMSKPRGAMVTEVRPNSPAEAAGVQVGDVVIDYAGAEVREPRELSAVVARTKIGSQQAMRVMRNGKEITLTVNVKEMPQDFKRSRIANGRTEAPEGTAITDLGIEVAPLTPEKAEQLGIKGNAGLLITGVANESLADNAGLGAGMVIEKVGSDNVTSLEEIQAALKKNPLNKGVLLLIRTAEGSRFVVIKQS